jgi:hypothetical protein
MNGIGRFLAGQGMTISLSKSGLRGKVVILD